MINTDGKKSNTNSSARKVLTCNLRKEKVQAFKDWCKLHGTTTNAMFNLIINSIVDDGENKRNARMELHKLYTMEVDPD